MTHPPNLYGYDDHDFIAHRVRELHRRNQLDDLRTLIYHYVTFHKIECTIEVDQKILPLHNVRGKPHRTNCAANNASLSPRFLVHPFPGILLFLDQQSILLLYLDFLIHAFISIFPDTTHSDCLQFIAIVKKIYTMVLQHTASFEENYNLIIEEIVHLDYYNEKLNPSQEALRIFVECFLGETDKRKTWSSHVPDHFLRACLAILSEKSFVANNRRFLVGIQFQNNPAIEAEAEWQTQQLLKYIFGLYEFSGGIDAPVWWESKEHGAK